MSVRYTGNKIYEYIDNNALTRFVTFTDKEWLLIYGNQSNNPQLMVFAIECNSLDEELPQKIKDNVNISFRLSKQVELPFCIIQFSNSSDNIELYWDSEWLSTTFEKLTEIFNYYGLVASNAISKDINQYSSSRFHDWQRRTLGNIKVTDLDLLEINQDKSVVRIYELKRSYIPLDNWLPYQQDFVNFQLIWDTVRNSSIGFYLLYNPFYKNGYNRVDDISKLKVFQFLEENRTNGIELSYQEIGIFDIEDVLK